MSIHEKIPTYTFLYTILAHFIVAITSFSIYGFKHIFFVIGHLFITFTQILLFLSALNIKTLSITLFGCIGHTFLIAFALYSMYKYGHVKWFLLFLIAQMGMIYFYLHHESDDEYDHPRFVMSFMMLLVYYVHAFWVSINHMKYPLLMIAGVYILFAYHYSMFILDSQKNHPSLQEVSV